MQSGKLRHRITIERPYTAVDTYGAGNVSWDAFADVWADIKPLLGREYFATKQIMSKATHKIRIRYIEGVTPQMRIKLGSRYLAIESVQNVEERGFETVIYAVEQQT